MWCGRNATQCTTCKFRFKLGLPYTIFEIHDIMWFTICFPSSPKKVWGKRRAGIPQKDLKVCQYLTKYIKFYILKKIYIYLLLPYLFCWYELSPSVVSVCEGRKQWWKHGNQIFILQTYRISNIFYYSFNFDLILTFRLNLIPKSYEMICHTI